MSLIQLIIIRIQTPIEQIDENTDPPTQTLQVYEDNSVEWETDIHLMATYAFLSDVESKQFAAHEQKYLIKEIHEYKFDNITGSKKVKIDSLGMIANWMFQFQRSDIFMRNEWSNLTNWEYESHKPYEILNSTAYSSLSDEILFFPQPTIFNGETITGDGAQTLFLSPEFSRNVKPPCGCKCIPFVEKLYNTGPYQFENRKDILIDMAILFDGQYREDNLDAGVYNYVDKYIRTTGNAKDNLFCYNFCLHTDPFDTQPSGAINMSRFKKIEFEINTYEPPRNENSNFETICDDDGDLIGVRQPAWDIFKYNYDLTVFEERYNIVSFIGGNCGLTFAR